MLHIKIKDKPYPVKTDVEAEFCGIELKDTPVVRKLMKEIEQAEYKDQACFVDRFGVTLLRDSLSTGCKAAILVELGNKPVDITECGFNARDSIINYCTHGTIEMLDTGITICKYSESIDVEMDGNHFKTIRELNDYIGDLY